MRSSFLLMKRNYNKIVKLLENSIVYFHVLKMKGAEKYGLHRKKKLYKDVNWINEQKEEFNNFWKTNYGKRIDSRGHKLYEGINGVFHKNYFPDYLFATKLEPKLNNYIYARLYSDKSLTELLYSKSPKLKMPQTYLVKSGGVWYDAKRKIINSGEVKNSLYNLGEAIIKPTIGGNSGKGIMFCDFAEGNDLNKETSIDDLINSDYNDFIIQEKMVQHTSFSALYPNSINTIRAITYIANEKTYHADLCLRMGTGGIKVDNIHAGGIVIGLSEDGDLNEYAYKLGYSDSKIKLDKHPDTNISFKSYKLEGIKGIIETAIDLHGLTPHMGIISWDFMVDRNRDPILIEANYMGQSVWFPQIAHAKPIFGEHTEYMLKLLKK